MALALCRKTLRCMLLFAKDVRFMNQMDPQVSHIERERRTTATGGCPLLYTVQSRQELELRLRQ